MKNNFLNEIEKELSLLNRQKTELEKRLISAPAGHLHARNNKHKYYQYYFIDDSKKEFLHRSDQELASKLAERDYYKHLLTLFEKRILLLTKLQKNYLLGDAETVYNQLPNGRRIIVEPFFLTDDEYINKWQKRNHKAKEKVVDNFNDHFPIATPILTNNNEQVRSKSEKIIADKFLELDIPYFYEPVLTLKNSPSFHPDFIVLNRRTKQEFYYEHFGMMDDSEYCNHTIRKLSTYNNNDYWFGDNLLYTFESSKEFVNTNILEKMICRYLL